MSTRPWLVVRDGLISGLAGTSLMTASTWAESRMRRGTDGLIDYDASKHVVIATARVLHVEPRTHRQRLALFLLTHWGYGSAVAIAHELLSERAPERISAPVFYAGCQTMAFALFPTIGGTPPPWQWKKDVLANSLAQHAVYTTATVVVSQRLRRRRTA